MKETFSENKLLFVSLSKDYWDGIWMSRHQIIKRLAKNNHVLFISPQPPIKDVLRYLKLGNRRKRGVEKITSRLYSVVPPLVFPKIYKSHVLDKLVLSAFVFYLKKIISNITYDKLILYLWHPSFFAFIGKFEEDLVCYHVHDQYKGYATTSSDEAKQLDMMEKYVLRRADLVFANGEMLRREKNVYGNAYNVPSAVDFNLFNEALESGSPEPREMKNIPKPRIGYIGRITRKVDLDLIEELVDRKPAYSFVLLGPLKDDELVIKKIGDLQNRSNFYYFSEKDSRQLPWYIKCLDVCLMPYVINEHTRFAYPLKLYEYLAMGKPIVASDMPCFHELSELIKVASSVDQWLEKIEKGLDERDNFQLIRRRIDIASQNSWDHRVAAIESLIYERLEMKSFQS